jgi:hypothetical protein
LWDRLDGPRIGLDAVTLGARLAKARTDGFGRKLLAGLEFTLVVAATDATTKTVDLRRPGGDVPADGIVVRELRFPPFIVHRLSLAPTAGDTVVADDPLPVYLQRDERTESEIGVGGTASMDAQRVRRALLRHMLRGAAAERPITDGRVLQVPWTTSERFLEAVRQGQRELVATYRELVETCCSSGLLSRDDAASLRPTLDVTLIDERAIPGELPAAPPFDLTNPQRRARPRRSDRQRKVQPGPPPPALPRSGILRRRRGRREERRGTRLRALPRLSPSAAQRASRALLQRASRCEPRPPPTRPAPRARTRPRSPSRRSRPTHRPSATASSRCTGDDALRDVTPSR